MAGWEHEPRIVIHDDPPPVPLGSGAKRARLRATARALAAGVGWLWSGLRFAALGLGPLAVLAFVVWVVVGEVRSQRVEIAPIAVPAQFAALGFTPEIMARRLLDQITTIQRRATTTMSRSEAALAGESADFALPGVGLSLSAVVQTLRTALGLPSARVTGEITLEGGSPTLRLRLAGQGPVSEVGAPWIDSMDGLLHEAAKALLLRISPYIVASYAYATQTDGQALLELAQRVERESFGPPETRWRAINLQGRIYAEKLGNGERAVAEYKRAIAVAPRYAGAHINLGNVLNDLRRREEAERSYREALRLDPRYATAHSNLGALLHDVGRREEAERSYREALRLDPRHTHTHYNLGLLLQEDGRIEEALEHARRAQDLDPRPWRARLVARLEEAQRDRQAAR